MAGQHYILATAGHVDHGKSALVKALTGIDPDRLPEEKARGITIDLGFAHLTLPARSSEGPASGGEQPGPAAPPSLELGIIDVPGHEDFVKNMVAGVGSIDVALLVVAADDGWMPQTEEHLQILGYLGVRHGVVALSKIDLAEDEAACVTSVRRHLQGSPLQDAPVVPTSTVSGRGLAELREALAQVVSKTPAPPDFGKPRLSVDRVFVVHGAGTVVTGTLAGGALTKGQEVRLQPRNAVSRIRGLQSHHCEIETAEPGMRVAFNLADVDAESGVARGDVVTIREAGEATLTLDVALAKSARLIDTPTAAARPLKDGSLVRVHLGTTNVPARVRLRELQPLLPGQVALAQLRLERPLLAFVGDRFILRDWPEQTTLAGGRVLEPDATRTGWLHVNRQRYLQACSDGIDSPSRLIQAWLHRQGIIRPVDLLRRSRFSAAAIRAAGEHLTAQGEAVARGIWLADRAWWQQLLMEAQGLVDRHHEHHPEQAGLPLPQIRAKLAARVPEPEVLDLLLADLTREGYRVQGQRVHRAAFRPVLPPHLAAAGDRLRQRLADQPLDVPSSKELAPDATSQQALRYLVETGEAVELGPELVIGTAAWNRARVVVRRILRERGRATTSELRQALGSSRRITIPLLELLDRQGLTQREGDHRVLRPQTGVT